MSSVRDDIRHGMTRAKNTPYAAIPEVIKHGVVIYSLDKGRSLERIVVAAPINIDNAKYYIGVMLKRDNHHQRLYAHDVVIEKESDVPSGDHLTTTGSADETNELYISDTTKRAKSEARFSKNFFQRRA